MFVIITDAFFYSKTVLLKMNIKVVNTKVQDVLKHF